jgi:nicotinate phosphoribosyltransferase
MSRATVSRESERVSGLSTDLYQLTMAAGYHHHQMAGVRASFHLFFRRAPFGGSYAVAAGLADALGRLRGWSFGRDVIAYLASLEGPDGRPLFGASFLESLRGLSLALDVDAVPEGTVVFPMEPILRVTGDLLACQLVETLLLSVVGYQTLVATKAARIKKAAGGRPVLEFGFRRAHGPEAAIAASRAAFIGGVDATSNVLAARLHDIPVRGTHAHSWVMAFGDERRAFEAYAQAMPGSSVFLVDTYGTEAGIDNAIAVAQTMRAQGRELRAIRLDSGDLARLARLSRARLDAAGLDTVRIIASNDLDEHTISALVASGAPIDAFGVGTRLVTGGNQPALGAVYKLGAVEEGGAWSPRMKLSSDPAKSSLPGRVGIARHFDDDGRPTHDVLYDADAPPADTGDAEVLLEPVMRGGALVEDLPSPREARARALGGVARLPAEVARLASPLRYSVQLDESLALLRERLSGEAHRAKAS